MLFDLIGFYASGGPAVADLVANLDNTLFANDSHMLHNLLPDVTVMTARTALIRPRSHERMLPIMRDNRNFFIDIC